MLGFLRKTITNGALFVALFFVSIFRIVFCTVRSILEVYEYFKDGSFWMALIYQPILISLVFTMSIRWIESFATSFVCENGEGVVRLVITVACLTAIILFFNALFELIIRTFFRNMDFDTVFSIQKHAHNYYLAIISLVAIYTAVNPHNANEINIIILVTGALVFLCIVITDLYDALFLSRGVVEKVYKDMIKYYDDKKRI